MALFFCSGVFFIIPLTVFGVQNGQGNANAQSQNRQQATIDDSTAITSQQNQNQTQTNNPNTGTMTQERIKLEIEENKPDYAPKNSDSQIRQNMAQTAFKTLMQLSYQIENINLANNMRIIAKAQAQAENQINQAVDNSKRGSVGQFFLGPKYQELKEAKQIMEQNRLRIRELQQIMTQLANQDEATQLQIQINTLELQNVALQNQLNETADNFSLFGWLIRWFYGV